MLELPESYAIAKQIEQTLTGKIISYVEVLHTPHKFAFFYGERDKYSDYLEGQTILRFQRENVRRAFMFHPVVKRVRYLINEPCMKCGYELHKENYMGGTVYFCEHCQKR